MSSKPSGEDVLTTHNYDGIQEYDNPMPGWWSFIFLTNIVMAVVYVVGINLNFFPDYQEDLRAEMAIQQELEDRAKKDLPPVTPEMLAEAAGKPDTIQTGAEVYAMNCAVCHGAHGQGLIGPNLTDDAWLNGDGQLVAIHKVVETGTTKGMPGWGPILLQTDIVAVVAFVKSLQGTNPPDPKAAEGVVPSAGGADSDG
jgi:cytochrome c oxidase cbb3-type subunit 3